MTTAVAVRKLTQEVEALRDDIREIKRVLAAPLADPEGKYRNVFVKKMFARAQSRGPFYRFTDEEAFLRHVRAAK